MYVIFVSHIKYCKKLVTHEKIKMKSVLIVTYNFLYTENTVCSYMEKSPLV